jgi:hypothetical protein
LHPGPSSAARHTTCRPGAHLGERAHGSGGARGESALRPAVRSGPRRARLVAQMCCRRSWLWRPRASRCRCGQLCCACGWSHTPGVALRAPGWASSAKRHSVSAPIFYRARLVPAGTGLLRCLPSSMTSRYTVSPKSPPGGAPGKALSRVSGEGPRVLPWLDATSPCSFAAVAE